MDDSLVSFPAIMYSIIHNEHYPILGLNIYRKTI